MSETETFLSEDILEKAHYEVIEHMKENGTFDDLRVSLTDSILDDEKFSEIIKQFELECQRFCTKKDLAMSRNALRSELAECFNANNGRSKTEAALKLERYIENFLNERESDLREQYNQYAREFLSKFLPNSESPTPDPPQLSPTTPAESIHKSPTPTSDSPSPQTRSEDMDLGSDPEYVDVPRPAYSPVSPRGALNEDLEIKRECDTVDVKETDQNNHDMEIDDPNEPVNNHDQNHIGEPADDTCGDDGEDDEDDDVSLDIDDVSSVSTADLVNFDDLIEVSDDEANLMGVPKKSKIPVETLAGDIENLKQTHIIVEPCDVPIPSTDPPPAEPSDTTNLSRNPPRNRKSNSRYHNEHFRLL